MSRTDKTRPWRIRCADTTSAGYLDPDYGWQAYHIGSENYLAGNNQIERKRRRHNIRQRERLETTRVLQLARAGNKDEHFDFKPIRKDCRTIIWDLT